LKPGTELVFDLPPKYGRFFWPKKAPGLVARFRQVEEDIRTTHHDALEFEDGTIVTLASLRPHQWATVLQLPMTLPTQTMNYPQGAPSKLVNMQID
jgi:hypothetical protein